MNCELCDCDFKRKEDLFRHFLTLKHLENFNEDQQKLIKILIQYIKSSEIKGQEGIRIDSAGGTGKTFTVSSVCKSLKNIICLGPTNKSVNVLRQQNIYALTFHKFFGWEIRIDEEGNEYSSWNTPKITPGTIFIIDEISMMTESQYSLFKHYIFDKFQFILMGDKYQLPPFENSNGVKDSLPKNVEYIDNTTKDLSLFFQFECKDIKLIKNMRAKNIKLNEGISKVREDVKNNKTVFLPNTWKFDLEHFKTIINRDYIVICHQNKDVKKYNDLIRQVFNPNNDEICLGDKIVLTQFYTAINKETCKLENLLNGFSGTITYFEKSTMSFKKYFGG